MRAPKQASPTRFKKCNHENPVDGEAPMWSERHIIMWLSLTRTSSKAAGCFLPPAGWRPRRQTPPSTWWPSQPPPGQEIRALMPSARLMFCTSTACVARDKRTKRGILRRSSSIKATSAVSIAASVPIAPMAKPISARARAGASLMPSPTMPTKTLGRIPFDRQALVLRQLIRRRPDPCPLARQSPGP